MKWTLLEEAWQESFRQAWEAYCKGSIPIGAALLDDKGHIVSRGRSRQFEDSAENGEIHRHKLSHAELNTLLKISAFDHPNIRQYTLYTTMEPCPLCFGASIMANIRRIKFAARDGFAGSCNLENAYIRGKNMFIQGPFDILEDFQIAVQVCYELERQTNIQKLVEVWVKDSPKGVALGEILYGNGTLIAFKKENTNVEHVFEAVTDRIESGL